MKQRIKFIFTTWFIAISLFTINAQDVQTNKTIWKFESDK